jgi:hypothetical protein
MCPGGMSMHGTAHSSHQSSNFDRLGGTVRPLIPGKAARYGTMAVQIPAFGADGCLSWHRVDAYRTLWIPLHLRVDSTCPSIVPDPVAVTGGGVSFVL